jgi:hypothetical protein
MQDLRELQATFGRGRDAEVVRLLAGRLERINGEPAAAFGKKFAAEKP